MFVPFWQREHGFRDVALRVVALYPCQLLGAHQHCHGPPPRDRRYGSPQLPVIQPQRPHVKHDCYRQDWETAQRLLKDWQHLARRYPMTFPTVGWLEYT